MGLSRDVNIVEMANVAGRTCGGRCRIACGRVGGVKKGPLLLLLMLGWVGCVTGRRKSSHKGPWRKDLAVGRYRKVEGKTEGGEWK